MTGDGFDRALAERYDRFCETPLGRYVDEVERALVMPLLELRPGLTVADLGCGTGSYTLELARAAGSALGVDRSAAMLAVARSKRAEAGAAQWLQADLTRLPLPDRAFDRVLIHVTLEFVDHPAAALREAWRVLAPGGVLVVGLILRSGPWARHYRRRARGDPSSVWRRARFHSVEAVSRWLGRPPEAVRFGLRVGPQTWTTPEAAWEFERATPNHIRTGAGFAALRWRR